VKIGIIGALPEEVEQIKLAIRDPVMVTEGRFTLFEGTLEGQQVVLAQCGIGKVNAAMVTQLLLRYGAEMVIFTGVAGAVADDLKVGDLVVGRDALQHDVDVTALGYEPGQVPEEPVSWATDERLRNLALEVARELAGGEGFEGVSVVEGRIASGDQFIADPERVRWLRDTFGASCAEMEGAAVAQTCANWSVPFLIIRSISDSAGHDAGIDFLTFTPLAAQRAKAVVRGMLARM
jgi:adenosylhomocysteine nucleosidase